MGKSWHLWVLAAFLTGCSNFSTFQTARTVPVGTFRLHLGGGGFSTNQLNSLVTSSSSSTTGLTFPFAELAGRVGLAERFDLGAKFSFPGSVGVDGKYQLIDAGAFALALGLQASYLPLTFNSNTSHLFDLAVPVYLSVDFTDWLGLYGSIRYLHRFQLGNPSTTAPFYSGGGGIRIGNQLGFMAEVTYVQQGNAPFRGVQFGGVFFFGTSPSAGYHTGRDGRWNKWRGRSESLRDTPDKRQTSVVIESLNNGRFLRVTQDDLRVWTVGEFVCAVDDKGKEAACGNVTRSDPKEALVRINRTRGRVTTGLEVILRP